MSSMVNGLLEEILGDCGDENAGPITNDDVIIISTPPSSSSSSLSSSAGDNNDDGCGKIDDSATPTKTLESLLIDDDLEQNGLLMDPNCCGICEEPLVVARMLHCLHVFCEQCLEKKLTGDGGGGDAGTLDSSIICPTCNYETKVGVKKVASLPLDVTKIQANTSNNNNMDQLNNNHNVNNNNSSPSDLNLYCTCCITKEVANSRCNTCHNLLCAHCECAHQYMRCFESHHVTALDTVHQQNHNNGGGENLKCNRHVQVNAIYRCETCQIFVCNTCLKDEHQIHIYEALCDTEMRIRQKIKHLMLENEKNVEDLVNLSQSLDGSLQELAYQRSTARDLIKESYQSFKAILEVCTKATLDKLNALYHERELWILKQNDEVGKSIGNFKDANQYVNRFLSTAGLYELVYLERTITNRLCDLNQSYIVNKPNFKYDKYHLEFVTDLVQFEAGTRQYFGDVLTEQSLITNDKNNNTNNMINNHVVDVVSSSSPSETSPMPILSAIAEYNIAQLATLAETNNNNNNNNTNNSNNSTNTTNPDNPTSESPFTFVDLFNNYTACKNIASLAKLSSTTTSVVEPSPLNFVNTSRRPTTTTASSSPLLNGIGDDSSPNDGVLSNILPPSATINLHHPHHHHHQQPIRCNKVSPMQIRTKFGQLGSAKGQFNSPHGFCLGLEEDIIVADTNNHRIQVFDKTGELRFQFGTSGKDEGQLYYPRKVAVMRNSGKYVICDRGNERSRMQIFTKTGHFLKKIGIRYIDIVAGLAVTADGHIVAVDSVSPTVFIITESGDLSSWFDCSDHMREPSDIAVHGKEFYVCDFKGHNVVVFSEEGHFLRRIGCESITNYPNGIDISDAGDILIGDSHGNRFHVAVFSRDGTLISEFECPYVKVSRCCGLKITSEGYVVTLAKNNHHVLVLNTLYIL